MLIYILLGGIMLSFVSSVYSADIDTDYGYVIVKCTVTIDVEVLYDWSTAWFLFEGNLDTGLAPNQYEVSATSIAVKNNSSGAILKYAVSVSSIQRNTQENGLGSWVADTDDLYNGIKGWNINDEDNNDGAGDFALAAVFKPTKPGSAEFGTEDYFTAINPDLSSRTNFTYKTGNNFDVASGGYSSAMSGSTNNLISPGEIRGLWFKILTPQAVTDQFPRRIIIRVDGTLAGSSW